METNVKALKTQFLFDLADIYDAEHRIAKALPKMIKPDTSEELKQAILSHARETEGHMSKVEQVFECFGQKAKGNTDAPAELLAERDEIAEEFVGSLASAAALISALQKVEPHEISSFGCQREWEIASYGCLNEWASLLGTAEAADLLEEILEEEKIADQTIGGCEADHFRTENRKAM